MLLFSKKKEWTIGGQMAFLIYLYHEKRFFIRLFMVIFL